MKELEDVLVPEVGVGIGIGIGANTEGGPQIQPLSVFVCDGYMWVILKPKCTHKHTCTHFHEDSVWHSACI